MAAHPASLCSNVVVQNGSPGDLSAAEWDALTRSVPIACVDLLPVLRDENGVIVKVGLIRRSSPFGERWCQLGGRVLRGETLLDAGHRHLSQTITTSTAAAIQRTPFFVNQYLQTPTAGAGLDPRKHAISICYLVEYGVQAPTTEVHGEADQFEWFATTQLPTPELWPGSEIMLAAIPAAREGNQHSDGAQDLVYSALNDRYISHNELMWQTPVLAMTAMAFLMTIALGSGAAWSRALAGLLSAAVATVSVQLMAKHSRNQIADADALWAMERRRGMPPVHAPPIGVGRDPLVGRALSRLERLLARGRSRRWWLFAMMLFGIVSFGVAVGAVIRQ